MPSPKRGRGVHLKGQTGMASSGCMMCLQLTVVVSVALIFGLGLYRDNHGGLASMLASIPCTPSSFSDKVADEAEEVVEDALNKYRPAAQWDYVLPLLALQRAIAYEGDMLRLTEFLGKVVLERKPFTVVAVGGSITQVRGGFRGDQGAFFDDFSAQIRTRNADADGWISAALDWLQLAYPPDLSRAAQADEAAAAAAAAQQEPQPEEVEPSSGPGASGPAQVHEPEEEAPKNGEASAVGSGQQQQQQEEEEPSAADAAAAAAAADADERAGAGIGNTGSTGGAAVADEDGSRPSAEAAGEAARDVPEGTAGDSRDAEDGTKGASGRQLRSLRNGGSLSYPGSTGSSQPRPLQERRGVGLPGRRALEKRRRLLLGEEGGRGRAEGEEDPPQEQEQQQEQQEQQQQEQQEQQEREESGQPEETSYRLINLGVTDMQPDALTTCEGQTFLAQLPDAIDLVLVDFAVSGGGLFVQSLDILLQQLLRRQPPPAVVFVNFFDWCRTNPHCMQRTFDHGYAEAPRNFSTLAGTFNHYAESLLPSSALPNAQDPSQADPRSRSTSDPDSGSEPDSEPGAARSLNAEEKILALAQYYGLPALSVRNGLYPLVATEPPAFTLSDLVAVDDVGYNPTHQQAVGLYADLLVALFQRGIARMAAVGEAAAAMGAASAHARQAADAAEAASGEGGDGGRGVDVASDSSMNLSDSSIPSDREKEKPVGPEGPGRLPPGAGGLFVQQSASSVPAAELLEQLLRVPPPLLWHPEKAHDESLSLVKACYSYSVRVAKLPHATLMQGWNFTMDHEQRHPQFGLAAATPGSTVAFQLDTSAAGGRYLRTHDAAAWAHEERAPAPAALQAQVEVKYHVDRAFSGDAAFSCVTGCSCEGGLVQGLLVTSDTYHATKSQVFNVTQSSSCEVWLTSRAGKGGHMFMLVGLSVRMKPLGR
eukprot:jgi/Mesen1/7623/ME000004S07892